jgi:hypothetical protein
MYLVAGAMEKWKVVWAFRLFHSLFAGTGLSIPHQGCPLFPLRSSAPNAAVSGSTSAASPALRLWPAAEFESAARASVPL